jgi:hypothetical protein
MSRCTTSIFVVDSSWAASDGRTTFSAAATIVPASATVSVTVCWSRSNTARCTSRTPARKARVNAPPPTTDDTTDSISGRAASRSAWFASTSSSVTRWAITARTPSSVRAAVARLANWSESTAAWRMYPTTSASVRATAARTTSDATAKRRQPACARAGTARR